MGQRLDSQTVDEDNEPKVVNDQTFDQKGHFLHSGEGSAELDHGVELELVFIRIPVDRNHSQEHEEDSEAS